MTCLEHLFETAIDCMEQNKCYDDWINLSSTKINAKHMTRDDTVVIWALAQYAVYTYKPSIVVETTQELEDKYGYKAAE